MSFSLATHPFAIFEVDVKTSRLHDPHLAGGLDHLKNIVVIHGMKVMQIKPISKVPR
jgi:hypothetical protein